MYEKFLEDMKAQMKPVMELAETNKATMEKLANLQKDAMTEVTNASLEQLKSLSACKDPKAAMELQVNFYKALEAKMADSAEKSIAVMSEAKHVFSNTIESAAKKAAADVELAVKKASGQ